MRPAGILRALTSFLCRTWRGGDADEASNAPVRFGAGSAHAATLRRPPFGRRVAGAASGIRPASARVVNGSFGPGGSPRVGPRLIFTQSRPCMRDTGSAGEQRGAAKETRPGVEDRRPACPPASGLRRGSRTLASRQEDSRIEYLLPAVLEQKSTPAQKPGRPCA